MTDWELILTMIGEKATIDITIEKNSQGFTECKDSAIDGGEAANEARHSVEKRLGRSILTEKNLTKDKKEIK